MSRNFAHLFHPANADGYAAVMSNALDHLTERLGGVTKPTTGRSPVESHRDVSAVDLDEPLGDSSAAIDEMTRLWLDDAVWFHDPGYAAHLNCPIVIPSLMAEVYASAVNTSLDTFDQSVGATFIERALISWTAGRIGFDATADGVFTSGGTQSNLHGLLLARERAVGGGASLSDLRIFTSVEAHFSVQKAARLLGLGEDAVVTIATDDRRRLDVGVLGYALAGSVARGESPMAVVATAGTTDFGAIDPIGAVADLCRTYDTWLHVDAAYGGGLLVSHQYAHLLAGIDRADSVTVDFHKTYFQPVACSAVIVRDPTSMEPVTWHADYLNPADSTNPNQVDKSLQTTRRFDALKLWMTLRVMGPDQIGVYLDTVIDLAGEVYDALWPMDDIEVAERSQLSTIVFRYAPDGIAPGELDELNAAIRAELYDEGASMVAATRVDGRRYLKMTLLNPLASRDDILGIVDRVRVAGKELHQASSVLGAVR